jgi:hypothetical protein
MKGAKREASRARTGREAMTATATAKMMLVMRVQATTVAAQQPQAAMRREQRQRWAMPRPLRRYWQANPEEVRAKRHDQDRLLGFAE